MKDVLTSADGINRRNLAEKYHVSEQSIKYDIYQIRSWLKEESINISLCYTSDGLKAVGPDKNNSNLFQMIEETYKQDYAAVEKRIPYIVFSLLTNRGYMTIGNFAKELLVSDSTVIRDANAAEELFHKLHIDLERKKHCGMRIDIYEIKRRQALEYFILKMFSIKEAEEIFSFYPQIPDFFLNVICEYILKDFNKEDLHKILRNFCMTFLRVCKIKMNVEDYIVMLVRICISLGQVKNEFFLDNEMYLLCGDTFIGNRIYGELKKRIKKFLIGDNLQIYDEEVQWVMLPIMTKMLRMEETDTIKFRNIAKKLINRVSNDMQVQFYCDDELLNNLSICINTIFMKRQFSLTGVDLISSTVMERFKQFYAVIKKISSGIFKEMGINLFEDEVSYIVSYFHLSYEYLCRKKKIKTLVVWSIQSPVNKFLVKQLKNNFNSLQIVDCCSISNVEKEIASRSIDFVVSIVPLNIKVPHVVVSVFLQQEDIWNIYKILMKLQANEEIIGRVCREKSEDNEILVKSIRKK